jgi:hypothetical protein
MKKIVGILAAAAIATSVFAADVSAAAKIDGTLFSYDNAKTFSLLKQQNGSHVYAQPNIAFSVSDDRAGAKILITADADGGDKTNVFLGNQTIWFKPVDALKITLGNYDVALNKESIKWTESVYMAGDGPNRAGYLLSVNVDAFSLDFGLQSFEATWFDKIDGEDDPAIGEFFLKAAYSADFGTIGAWAEFNRMSVDKKTRRSYGQWESFFDDDGNGLAGRLFNINPKDGAIKDIAFAAGYRNNFDGLDVFVNFGGYMDDTFEWIRPEIFVSGNADAFGYKAFVAPVVYLDSDVKDYLDYTDQKAFSLQVLCQVQYALDNVTVYARFDDLNLLAKKFVSEIKLGAQGSVGCMSYDAWLQINTGKGPDKDKFDISLPFQLKVNF